MLTEAAEHGEVAPATQQAAKSTRLLLVAKDPAELVILRTAITSERVQVQATELEKLEGFSGKPFDVASIRADAPSPLWLNVTTLIKSRWGIPVMCLLPIPEPTQVPLLGRMNAEVRGRVLDEMGFPLRTPEVYLTWSHTHTGVHSTAIRRTAADAEGYFRFKRLGSGPHQVSVNIPGYRTGRMNHNIGNTGQDIVVQLEPEM